MRIRMTSPPNSLSLQEREDARFFVSYKQILPVEFGQMFAEVAVPVYIRQTFTYRLPGDMATRAHVGSRVQVPFGKKYLTAFIVDLHEKLDDEVDETQIKEVEELLDESPVITPEILELTKWVADYYFAPWGECLRAALPAGAISISEQMLELTPAGRVALTEGHLSSSKQQGLELMLSGSGEITSRQFERQLTKPRAGALIRQLSRDGLIRVSQRIAETRMKPKLHNVVRLSQGLGVGGRGLAKYPTDHGLRTSTQKQLNEKQSRVVEFLRSADDAVPFSELLDAADVSSSVVRTLEKRGVVEVF